MITYTEIVLKPAKPSGKFGKHPELRTAHELLSNGVVNIDKPSGPSSHQVSAYVKQILQIKKTGHAGTLDPKVTGVLPVALGKATRVVQALLPSGKTYVCVMHLHKEVSDVSLSKAFQDYTGKIKQLPPVKSAVKRQIRERNVYSLDLIERQGQDVLFTADVQAGTYIRKLCHDLGEHLGSGAHMAELRRIRAGPFDESTLVTLQDLSDAIFYLKEGNDKKINAMVFPVEAAVRLLKKVWVLDATVDSLTHGATLKVPGIAKMHQEIQFDDIVAVMTLQDELIGLGRAKMSGQDMQKFATGVSVKLDQVFMSPGVYPKMEV